MFRFVVKFIISIEENVAAARYGVIVFGIAGSNQQAKRLDASDLGGGVTNIPPPYGNNNATASEVALTLAPLQIGCKECNASMKSSWSQLEMLYTLVYDGSLTPTWDGMYFAEKEYDLRGDPTVPGRFVVLITDGVPNDVDGNCVAPSYNPVYCGPAVNKTNKAVNAVKEGTLVLTVGMNLDASTQPYMIEWASDPKDLLAIPSTDYSALQTYIPRLLRVMCSGGGVMTVCLEPNVTKYDLEGFGFLNTGTLGCRFYQDNQAPASGIVTKAYYKSADLITCDLPTNFTGEWNLEYTRDGRGYYKGAKLQTASVCRTQAPTPVPKDTTTNDGFSFAPANFVTLVMAVFLFMWC